MKHIKTLNTEEFAEYSEERWLWRMSDILSICVQDILYGRKSKLRAKISSCAEVISSGVKSAALILGAIIGKGLSR